MSPAPPPLWYCNSSLWSKIIDTPPQTEKPFYFLRETRIGPFLPLSWPEAGLGLKYWGFISGGPCQVWGLLSLYPFGMIHSGRLPRIKALNLLTRWASIRKLKEWFDMAMAVKEAPGSFQGSALSILELWTCLCCCVSFSKQLESIVQILGPALQVS